MDPSLNVSTLAGLGGAFVVIALVEVIKRTLALADGVWQRVVPGLSLLVGIAWNLLVVVYLQTPWRWVDVVVLGISAGLMAMGLWSGTKSTLTPQGDGAAARLRRG